MCSSRAAGFMEVEIVGVASRISWRRSVRCAVVSFGACWDSSTSACRRPSTAGLPILARCPDSSCDIMGADSPRTWARPAWVSSRSPRMRPAMSASGSP